MGPPPQAPQKMSPSPALLAAQRKGVQRPETLNSLERDRGILFLSSILNLELDLEQPWPLLLVVRVGRELGGRGTAGPGGEEMQLRQKQEG